ncbi:MAG: phosphoadenosine phosphosulfate reductase family protein [Thermodesulfobacteriota bacterium]
MILAEKIEESLSVLRYALDAFNGSLAVTFSGGKDSLVTLHLIHTLGGGTIPFPVFNLDTTVKFPEAIQFRDYLADLWGLHLVVLRNAEAARGMKIGKDKKACCLTLKVQPLNQAIVEHRIRGLITAIRWDEQEARAQEQYLSPRELPPHTRIHPILHFTEADIWDYIHAFDLPYCRLYDQGYRSLSCIPCTGKNRGEGDERQGRSKDKENIMQELRLLGYI